MNSFSDLSLPDELQQALVKLQFKVPTDVQKAVLPVAIQGSDLIACAQTGSGKTAAYGIPLVNQLLVDSSKSALILAPTRELAQQIADFLRELTINCKNLQVTSIVGGADIRKQFRSLKKKPRIIVATPGRLTDHLKRKTVHLKSTEILVLDEGDRMLDMGFAPQLDEILKYLPQKRQTSLFTATLPQKIQKLAESYLHQPKNINVGQVSQPVSTIRQSIIQVKMKEKDDRILDELNRRQGSVIVFIRTKHRTDQLASFLDGYGLPVDLIHGGRSQGQRNKAIRNFKEGKSRILCATDVASRGIDIPQVEHVINFDLPMMDEDYVHRIGRTARNGASGEAVSFVTPGEHRAWISIARKYRIQGVELKPVKKGEVVLNSRSRFKGKKKTAQTSTSDSRPTQKTSTSENGKPSRFKPKNKSKKASAKKFSSGKPSSKSGSTPGSKPSSKKYSSKKSASSKKSTFSPRRAKGKKK